MIRIALALAVMVLVFCGTLLGAAFYTGTVTQDDLDALLGKAPSEPKQILPQVDELNATARKLRDQEEMLNQWEEALDEREHRVEQETAELNRLVAELEQIQMEIDKSLEEAQTRREQDWSEIATSIGAMEPAVAADTLVEMFKEEPETAAEIVRAIESNRVRGEILNNLDPVLNKDLFLLLQAPPY